MFVLNISESDTIFHALPSQMSQMVVDSIASIHAFGFYL